MLHYHHQVFGLWSLDLNLKTMQTVPGSTPTHYWLETSEYTTNKILQYRMNHPPLNIQRTKSYNTEWTTHLWIYNEQNLTMQNEPPTSEYTTNKILQHRVNNPPLNIQRTKCYNAEYSSPSFQQWYIKHVKTLNLRIKFACLIVSKNTINMDVYDWHTSQHGSQYE